MVRVGVGLWEVPSSNPNETKNRKKKKKLLIKKKKKIHITFDM